MYIAILGRQPVLGMAELEHLYGSEHTRQFSPQTTLITTDRLSVAHLGGSQKIGHVVRELPAGDWRQVSTEIIRYYTKALGSTSKKLTIGISSYDFSVASRDIQQTGLILKQRLKKSGVSVRLIPNTTTALSTATSHHNKLGLSDNKIELLVVKAPNGNIIIAESTGAQNITAYAKRDQQRPKRDVFVGMLPPKLAQIMINLATTAPPNIHGQSAASHHPRLLDPFCGTGVILQEAALMGYAVYGTDLSEKMIDYTHSNLEWLENTHRIALSITLYAGDAMSTVWQPPIDMVVGETYLGQPFSAPPSPEKLDHVKKTCNHIISTFLKNIGPQLQVGTPMVIAIPAWRDISGHITHLSLTKHLDDFGFQPYRFTHVDSRDLIYYREDQVVARELLVLTKA